MTTLIGRLGSPSKEFPHFMSFDVHPCRGPNLNTWMVKPYRDWGLEEEAVKNVFMNTAIGSAIGGSVAAGWNLLAWDKISDSFKKLKECVMTGCMIGGFIGAVKGIIDTQSFFLDRPTVMNKTFQSTEKAKEIIEAFVSSEIGLATEESSIYCPISLEIMAYPVKTPCNSKAPHTFEYYHILNWLSSKSEPNCPTCRQPVQIKQLQLNPDKEREIHEKVAVIFRKMEAILQRLPKRFLGFDGLPHFSETQQIAALAEKIHQGKQFLDEDIEKITAKIKNPETLSEEEAFALGHFVVHQMQPLKHKIDQIYRIAGDHLRSLRTQSAIDKDTYATQLEQLENWYTKFNIIPEDCQILNKLYHL